MGQPIRRWVAVRVNDDGTKSYAEVATEWQQENGMTSLSIVEETDLNGKFKKLAFVEALQKNYGLKAGREEKKYLNVYDVKPRETVEADPFS